MKTNLILGKGKVFNQQTAENTALVIIDSIQPEGFTEIALDCNGYTPHLGNMHDQDPEGVLALFKSTCLNLLGTCIAPVGPGRQGSDALKIKFETGGMEDMTVPYGEVNILPIRDDLVEASFTPVRMDLGKGQGRIVTKTVRCGSLGLIIDTRGRPVERKVKPVGLMALERRVT
jgi:hypothetical protein